MELKVVAIGLRIHGEYAIQEMLKAEGVSLVAIMETEERWRTVAERYGVPFYRDYARMLAEVDCNTAIVCLPNDLKTDAVIECLKRGKHAISDKPMSITEEELGRLERQIAASDAECSVLLTERFNPLYVKAKELIDQGAIGEIAGCIMMRPHESTAQREEQWMYENARNGGLIVDLMIHDIDLALWMSRGEVREVTARSLHTRFFADKPDYVDFAQALFVLEGGVTVHVEADWLTPRNTPWDCRMLVVGTDGTIEVLSKSGEVILCTHDRNHRNVMGEVREHDSVCLDFVRRIRGEQPQILSAADCVASARAVLLARRSSESGQLETARIGHSFD
ncbi:Gfo/Idh/MocA family protein [Cohnella hashimotonis]|uniref:Gfo/Idh/MocA family oxidoreductase n=1 Tax=Cohnella hashimotonis TaxID=2826895 RepID=A0ABT6TFI4_9BACL|nr:Gfo/Idh/MocA family oxidoreductase [Cohnella hashimotonis]MDI4645602.1 Gfo/Idh/MocA family oxidoreductase [Cohnella hashimotonis]